MSLPSYEGPLLSLTGGVDCSFLLSGAVGGLAYVLLTAGAAADRETESATAPEVTSRV